MFKKALAIAALALPLAAAAQDAWPSKPITFVVPYPPGGPTDLMARLIAMPMISAMEARRFEASGNLAVNQYLYKKLGFDPVKDLAPVMQISRFPLVLEVSEKSPIKNFKDYVNHARKADNRVTFGSAGNGTPQHLGGELFKATAKVDISHVPYKGAGPAIVDLVGGQIQVMFDNMPSALPMAKDGKIRALAVTTEKRSPAASELPTVAEQFDAVIKTEARKMDGLIRTLNIQLD